MFVRGGGSHTPSKTIWVRIAIVGPRGQGVDLRDLFGKFVRRSPSEAPLGEIPYMQPV